MRDRSEHAVKRKAPRLTTLSLDSRAGTLSEAKGSAPQRKVLAIRTMGLSRAWSSKWLSQCRQLLY